VARRRVRIQHAQVVWLFAAGLLEVWHLPGMTQAELARQAHVTTSYIGRLESGGAAPGIDLVDRLARALGTTTADLLPTAASPDTLAVLRQRAQGLFDNLMQTADRETLLMVNPLLARLVESSARSK
jgi:transcriptional regulator with XRE-family HTH domain